MAKKYSDFESLRPRLLALARLILRDVRVRIEPEDLVQTVLTEIYSKLREGTIIKNPQAYANTALKNRALDEIRRFHNRFEHNWPVANEDAQPWEPLDPGDLDPEKDPVLREVLLALDPPERCFLWHVVFEQRSVHEAQKLCGWPPKSPYFHYRKLLDRIRPLIGLEPEE